MYSLKEVPKLGTTCVSNRSRKNCSSEIKASFYYEKELTEDQKRTVEFLNTYLDDAEGE